MQFRSYRLSVPALLLALFALFCPLAGLAATAATPSAAAPAPAISAAQAQQVLAVLNNPAKRAAFITTLNAIARSLPAAADGAGGGAGTAAAPGNGGPKKIVVAPNSIASGLSGEIGVVRTVLVTQLGAFARIFGNTVLASRWLRGEWHDPHRRAVLVDAAWRGAMTLVVGVLVERGMLRLLRQPLSRLARERHYAAEDAAAERGADSHDPVARDATRRERTLRLLRRVPFAVLRLLLKLLPLALFVAIGAIAAASFAVQPVTRFVILIATNLYVIARLFILAMDTLLAPQAPGVRLIGMSDSTASLLSLWWAWLVAVPAAAIALTKIGDLLDLPQAAGLSILRAMVLLEHVLAGLLIWRVHGRVSAALTPPKRWRGTGVGVVLTRMARNWWIPALFLDFALWLVWAARLRNGYSQIGRLFLVTIGVLFAGRLVAAILLGLLDRMVRLNPGFETQYPGLGRRAERYYPLLRRIVNAAVVVTAAIVLLQAWGIPSLAWFTRGKFGARVASALISILIAVALGVTAWETANAALDRQVARFGEASQAVRAARLQTLLPILRTVLFIALFVIVGLSVLREVGVDVTPLLAGAGIIGVALGFGSQKLVQDFITGIFLLVENAMQVGDTVTAAGVTGTVEHLSIRTLRLRGGDGSVQIIPFSSVTTVTNLSRDFAVAAISISIAPGEDVDTACAVLREIGGQMRSDVAFSELIVDDFGLNGVDSIGEYAVAISGTMRCTIPGRWPVQREFYRRLNAALAAHHISLPARPLALTGARPGTRPGTLPGRVAEPEKDCGNAMETAHD